MSYQYDVENRLAAVYDKQKLLMANAYDGDGNRVFQLNYNTGAICGYGKNISGEVFASSKLTDENGNLTAEGELFSYINSCTGRSYDMTEYVNDITRPNTEVLMEETNRRMQTYHVYGNTRESSNSIW